MTINIQSMGSNSWYIAYTNNENISNLFNSITTVMGYAGWTLHDDQSTYKVYKAPIKNASTFKYIKLTYASGTNSIDLSVYESWNSSTHIGTNQCNYSGTATDLSQSIDMVSQGGYLYVFANARYFMWVARRNSDGKWGYNGNNIPCGCSEIALDSGEVAGTYPSFGLINTYAMNGNLIIPSTSGIGLNTYNASGSIAFRLISTPRSSFGFTGASAEGCSNLQIGFNFPRINYNRRYMQVSTLAGGPSLVIPNVTTAAIVSVGTKYYFFGKTALSDLLPTGNNPATGLPYCITPHVIEMETTYGSSVVAYRGRLHGTKFAGMGKGWSMLDVVNVKVDSELFHDSAGNSTQHYYLGNNIIIPA